MDGIINIYKEKDFTSHDVVAIVRKILKQKKVGHAGTLDPNAQGVLPVLAGRATRFSDLVTDGEKEYRAEIIFGAKMSTGDSTGEVLETSSTVVDEQNLISSLSNFLGEQLQTPPMYSAIKINGQKLCDLARQGINVPREPRKITIKKIELIEFNSNKAIFDVICSKGTYIRALCEDIGTSLGTVAHMGDLWRTRVAGFNIKNAITLNTLKEMVENEKPFFIDVEELFDFPKVYIKETATKLLYNGNELDTACIDNIDNAENKEFTLCRVYDSDGSFVGLYNYGKALKVFKMYRTGI